MQPSPYRSQSQFLKNLRGADFARAFFSETRNQADWSTTEVARQVGRPAKSVWLDLQMGQDEGVIELVEIEDRMRWRKVN